jgi:hypothetical protein
MICIFISSIGVCDNYVFKIITESIVFFVAFMYLLVKTDKVIHKKGPYTSDRSKITKFIL